MKQWSEFLPMNLSALSTVGAEPCWMVMREFYFPKKRTSSVSHSLCVFSLTHSNLRLLFSRLGVFFHSNFTLSLLFLSHPIQQQPTFHRKNEEKKYKKNKSNEDNYMNDTLNLFDFFFFCSREHIRQKFEIASFTAI